MYITIQHTGYNVILKRIFEQERNSISYIPSYHGVFTVLPGDPVFIAGDLVIKGGSSQDLLDSQIHWHNR